MSRLPRVRERVGADRMPGFGLDWLKRHGRYIRVRIRPGLARQAIRLPSPQPWVMLVAEAR